MPQRHSAVQARPAELVLQPLPCLGRWRAGRPAPWPRQMAPCTATNREAFNTGTMVPANDPRSTVSQIQRPGGADCSPAKPSPPPDTQTTSPVEAACRRRLAVALPRGRCRPHVTLLHLLALPCRRRRCCPCAGAELVAHLPHLAHLALGLVRGWCQLSIVGIVRSCRGGGAHLHRQAGAWGEGVRQTRACCMPALARAPTIAPLLTRAAHASGCHTLQHGVARAPGQKLFRAWAPPPPFRQIRMCCPPRCRRRAGLQRGAACEASRTAAS